MARDSSRGKEVIVRRVIARLAIDRKLDNNRFHNYGRCSRHYENAVFLSLVLLVVITR